MIKRFVRQRLFSVCLAFSLCFSAELVQGTRSFAAPLPDIEAHTFQSTPVRTSKSKRIYLFKATGNDLPKTGNLVLIHVQNKPAMAFRVLKTDSKNSEYVAKRIRRYDQTGELNVSQAYDSIEKISDLLAAPAPDPVVSRPARVAAPATAPAPINVSESDQDLDAAPKPAETNLEVYDYEDDLDATTSPQAIAPKKKRAKAAKVEQPVDEEFGNEENNEESTDETDEGKTAFEIEEAIRLSPLRNMISVNTGLYKNMSNFKFAGGTHSGFHASYARTLRTDIFVLSKAPQDSLSIEFGLGYYSLVNFIGQNDVFKIVPIMAELHYNLFFSQTFGMYLYGGLEFNAVMATENVTAATLSSRGDQDSIDKLQGIQHTFGLGLLYNMGPQWYLRLNLGWDRITAGLAIKW